jgi:RimJ/RimL family protein N-acetyltransferase
VAHDFSLETERLRLRPFAPGDFEALLAMQSRPDVARRLYREARDADAVRAALEAKLGRAAISAGGEGLSFAVEWVKGERQSERVYAILEHEWSAQTAT